MSYKKLCIHTCTVSRRTYGAADVTGQPVETWTDVYTDQRCRFTQQISFTGIQGYEYYEHKRVTTHQDTVFFPKGLVIRGDDRISNICRKDGTVVDAGPFDVTEIRLHSNSKRDHHIECVLDRIKAGGT